MRRHKEIKIGDEFETVHGTCSVTAYSERSDKATIRFMGAPEEMRIKAGFLRTGTLFIKGHPVLDPSNGLKQTSDKAKGKIPENFEQFCWDNHIESGSSLGRYLGVSRQRVHQLIQELSLDAGAFKKARLNKLHKGVDK